MTQDTKELIAYGLECFQHCFHDKTKLSLLECGEIIRSIYSIEAPRTRAVVMAFERSKGRIERQWTWEAWKLTLE